MAVAVAAQEEEQQEVLEEEHEQQHPCQLTVCYQKEWTHFEDAFLQWMN